MTEIKLSDIFKSKLLIDKINREQLSVFLESQNLYAYRDKNKNEKLEYLLENIKKENIEEANTLLENTDEFYTLHDNFSIFLSEQAKYTSNRTIITTPVNLSSNSPLFNTNEFNKRFPNYMEYNNVSLIDDEELETSLNESPGRYFQFFEKKIESNGQINLVSKGFVSKKKQRTRPHQDEADIIVNPLLDFVWVDIYPQKKYYRIHISERLPSTEGQLSFEEIYNLFSQKIEDEFNLIPAEHSGANVLYG